MPNPRTPGQASESITPSQDFRTTVDITQLTKAIYIAATGETAFTVHNEITNQDITFKTNGQVLPVSTQTAVTIAGFDVVYLY